MYLRRKVDAFLEEWKYNLIRPFIEKVDGLSFCQSSLPLRTWLKISSTFQLKCYIAAVIPHRRLNLYEGGYANDKRRTEHRFI